MFIETESAPWPLALSDHNRHMDYVDRLYHLKASRNKHQTTSRSIQIKNKKPSVLKSMPGEFCPSARNIDKKMLLAAQKQSKFIQNGGAVSATFHCA
ncbi:hypothetical protein TNCV_4856121 [Trichonephila clavipes]|nr:hypothetical protein TNCV_4856121 [Trichonephila clavipes]